MWYIAYIKSIETKGCAHIDIYYIQMAHNWLLMVSSNIAGNEESIGNKLYPCNKEYFS